MIWYELGEKEFSSEAKIEDLWGYLNEDSADLHFLSVYDSVSLDIAGIDAYQKCHAEEMYSVGGREYSVVMKLYK